MPELPEVETVRSILEKKLKNKVISDVVINYDGIIKEPTLSEFKKKIVNQKINSIKRKGKLLIFELDDYVLLSHLRMEGKYLIKETFESEKHEHLAFKIENFYLIYKDVRKFGTMHLVDKNNYKDHKTLQKIGPEPFDINVESFYKKIISSRKEIKTLILNQEIISGIGNIYADEVLFKSKISPFRKGNELSLNDTELIVESSKSILNKSIELGGTTIRTYKSLNDKEGTYQNELYVHTRENLPCKVCSTIIKKDKIAGRGTYFCPECQK